MNSDADYRHYTWLSELTASGGVLSRESPHVSLHNERWYADVSPTAERLVVHHQLKVPVEHDSTLKGDPPRAIFTAGPPGAGKSGAVATALQIVGADRRFRIIDPDRVKDDLLRASLRDGSYHSWLMPDEVWQLHAAGERFHPRELASLVQAESGRVAGALRNDAIAARADFVMEGTLQGASHAAGMLKKAAKAGYEITIVNVECSQSQAEQRCFERWQAGRHTALAADADERRGWDDRLGGRFVPPEFIASCFDPQNGESAPAAVARELFSTKLSAQLLTFRLRADDAAPQLESVQRWEHDKLITLPGSEVLAGLDLPENRLPRAGRLAPKELRLREAAPQERSRKASASTPRGWTPRRPPGRPGRQSGLER